MTATRDFANEAEIETRFTEQKVAQILRVLSEASNLAGDADALSGVALIEGTLRMVRMAIWPPRSRLAPVPLGAMAERVKVSEAVRRTGVPEAADERQHRPFLGSPGTVA